MAPIAVSTPETWRAFLEALAYRSYPLTSKLQIRPIDFKLEALILAFAILYSILHVIGKRRNRSKAETWVKEVLPAINREFATTADDGKGKGEMLLWNGGDEAVLYASGRRSVESLHAHFSLSPRHDPLQHFGWKLYDFALATQVSSVRDTLTLTYQLPPTTDNTSGVFAIADKSVLQSLRKARPFDLSFARLLEESTGKETRGLDKKWAILSENSELVDQFLGVNGPNGQERREKLSVQEALNSQAGQYLESLILTDLPQDPPEGAVLNASAYPRLLILNLRIPKTAKEARETIPLLVLSGNLLDAIEFDFIKPSTNALNKIKRTRLEVEKELQKEAEKEKKELEEEARLKKKKEDEDKKMEGLSAKEQAKRKEVEEKRARRKAQGKMKMGRG